MLHHQLGGLFDVKQPFFSSFSSYDMLNVTVEFESVELLELVAGLSVYLMVSLMN